MIILPVRIRKTNISFIFFSCFFFLNKFSSPRSAVEGENFVASPIPAPCTCGGRWMCLCPYKCIDKKRKMNLFVWEKYKKMDELF